MEQLVVATAATQRAIVYTYGNVFLLLLVKCPIWRPAGALIAGPKDSFFRRWRPTIRRVTDPNCLRYCHQVESEPRKHNPHRTSQVLQRLKCMRMVNDRPMPLALDYGASYGKTAVTWSRERRSQLRLRTETAPSSVRAVVPSLRCDRQEIQRGNGYFWGLSNDTYFIRRQQRFISSNFESNELHVCF